LFTIETFLGLSGILIESPYERSESNGLIALRVLLATFAIVSKAISSGREQNRTLAKDRWKYNGKGVK
jgi:hypothetical protein